MPSTVCKPEQIVELVQSGGLNVPYGLENEIDDQQDVESRKIPPDATRLGDISLESIERAQRYQLQRSFAVDVIKNKRIWHVPESACWIVRGSKEDNYAVSLYSTEKCSCSALGNCYHLQAVKMGIGQTTITGKRILNMSRIRSASKKRQNRYAGKKMPRPIDIFDANQCEVNPPPDA